MTRVGFVVLLLLKPKARADLDRPCSAGTLFRGVELFCRVLLRLQKDNWGNGPRGVEILESFGDVEKQFLVNS